MITKANLATLDGTPIDEDLEFHGEASASSVTFVSAPFRRDWMLSNGTGINEFPLVRGVEFGGAPLPPSTATGGRVAGEDISVRKNYWLQALGFLSEGIDESIEIQADFDRLAATLKSETAHLSSAAMITGHQAFPEIVGMGKEAIPLILRDLRQAPTLWFLALRSIARESPIRPEDRGNVEKMTAAWLDWGQRRRYI